MVPSTRRPFLGPMLAVLTASLVAPCARGDGGIHTLISFNLSNGNQPAAGLVQGPDGAFYGTTQTGGLYNQGTVFKISSNGAFTNLLSFSGITGPYPGADPAGNLVLGVNGNFYGTTESGGASNNGTLFEMTPTGGFTNLISFTGTNGVHPGGYSTAGLILGTNGSLYGTTQSGGTNDLADGGDGTVFQLATNGVFTSLVSFSGTNGAWLGANPGGGLVLGTDGNLYGTTQYGGTNDLANGGDGTVFRITPAGVFTSLFSFNTTNGANPQAGLVQAGNGSFYGTTYSGGSNALGTVFKMNPQGLLTSLLTFNNANGANPQAGLVPGLDGDLYGTTKSGGMSNYGTVFQITPAGRFTSLVSFANTNGAYPVAGLIQGRDGNFYGTTASGGTNYAYGTVFRFTPPPLFLKQWQTNGAFAFTWSTATGQTYQVQFITALGHTNWSNLGSALPATNASATVADSMGTNQQRFYRVELEQ
jgi:uncharacterized repeat protein (TIGR03803 family)